MTQRSCVCWAASGCAGGCIAQAQPRSLSGGANKAALAAYHVLDCHRFPHYCDGKTKKRGQLHVGHSELAHVWHFICRLLAHTRNNADPPAPHVDSHSGSFVERLNAALGSGSWKDDASDTLAASLCNLRTARLLVACRQRKRMWRCCRVSINGAGTAACSYTEVYGQKRQAPGCDSSEANVVFSWGL